MRNFTSSKIGEAKSIANRIKLVLPNLINHDQAGFVKGRFIGENIRLIDSIIQYATEKNIPGLLLFIDFEKAFDSLEWSFIHDTLRSYGFGASLINWVKTLYSHTGCPLSPYLSYRQRCLPRQLGKILI